MSERMVRLSQTMLAALLVGLAAFVIDPSSTAAITAVLLFVVVAAVLAATDTRISPQTLAIRGRRDRFAAERPSRQCDPDAAGHIRARAPGQPS